MNFGVEGLAQLTQNQLEIWVREAQQHSQLGQLPNYIPQLAQVNPQEFAVQIVLSTGQRYTLGNQTLSFPLMSVIKPFLFLNRLIELGKDQVFSYVGVTPSDQPFNSLEQLQADQGIPRNPMINSGAIALASLLPGNTADSRCHSLCSWLNQQADSQFFLDHNLLASVRSAPNQKNQALIAVLAESGLIQDPDLTLDTYNQICCLSGTLQDLAQLGLLLIQPPQPQWLESCRIVKAVMMTCGLYEASAKFAVEVGLPSKSGVSGAVLSIIPHQGAIACYSPPLNPEGNSIGSLFLIAKIAHTLNLSIFN